MARRVLIRSRQLNTAIAQLEEAIAADYKSIWKEHIDDLEALADWIVEDALTLVPEHTNYSLIAGIILAAVVLLVAGAAVYFKVIKRRREQ